MGRRQRTRARQAGSTTTEATAAPTGRYTPPKTVAFRIRPTWHKVAGVIQVLLGIALVVINYIDYAASILPGGHQEAYFLLGIVIAGGASWWFGAFDREPSPEEVRRQFAQQRKQ